MHLGEHGFQYDALTFHTRPVIASAALTDTTVAQRLHAVQRLQAGLLYAGKFLALLDTIIPDNTVQFQKLCGGFYIDLYAAQRIDDF